MSASPPAAPLAVSASARWWAIAGLVAAALILGSGHVLARWAYQNGVDIFTAAAVRTITCALFLAGFLLVVQRRAPLPLPAGFARTIPIALCLAVQTISIQGAVSMVPVGVAILVMYLFPFLTGVVSAWTGEVKFTGRLAFTLVAALLGLTLVVGVGAVRPDTFGVALAFVAAVAFTGALVLTPRLAPGLNPPLRMFCTMVIVATLITTLAVALGRFHLPDGAAGRLALVGLSLCYAVGISLVFILLPRLGPVPTAVTLNLEPVMVAVIAWATLGEAFTLMQSLGAALVVGAVIYFQAFGRR